MQKRGKASRIYIWINTYSTVGFWILEVSSRPPKNTVSGVQAQYSVLSVLDFSCILALKQTKREKGTVRRTRPKERAVRIQPHSPIPGGVSSTSSSATAIQH
jgi:hypothetical protein